MAHGKKGYGSNAAIKLYTGKAYGSMKGGKKGGRKGKGGKRGY